MADCGRGCPRQARIETPCPPLSKPEQEGRSVAFGQAWRLHPLSATAARGRLCMGPLSAKVQPKVSTSRRNARLRQSPV